MSLTNSNNIRYLKISAGKLREKVAPDHPRAKQRFVPIANNNKGAYVHELEYSSCSGFLEEIVQQTHPEYGTSYSLILRDEKNDERFSLQITENSRYFQSLVMHLPNINISAPIEVIPYEVSKNNGKKNIGISFKQHEEKIENYYKHWDETTKKSTYKNGLEKFNFAKVKDDKDERKILQVKFNKFLRTEMASQIARVGKEANKFTYKIGEEAPILEDMEQSKSKGKTKKQKK